MSKHAVIMAGGTGGHIYPALAVAEELKNQDFTVSWLGTRRGLESQLVPKAGIEIDYIDVEGVRGKGKTALMRAPFVLSKAVAQARSAIKQRNASVVLGFGGFVAGPGGVAAKLAGLPLIIHEQNAVAGTTNKLLAKIATTVFTAFPNVFTGARVVGNPVRKAISQLPAPSLRLACAESTDSLQLLVLGGSLGAAAINELVPAALAVLRANLDVSIHVVHQCGGKNVEQTKAAYADNGITLDDTVVVQPFVDDMAAAYGKAHFIVCRAGALTVAEIAAAGCASLMVPFPHAIDDHQTANAQWLVEQGAAHLCQQKDLTVARLVEELSTAAQQRTKILTMAENARLQAKTDAAEQVAQECVEVLSRGR
ncbi:undecaprenyldiphospho-muramoylpentapeptide beta-N-acetylglucosaminyltransferase [Halioxenophilus aromaticivorans]|uniref:UDP-N-acetylglucosamine--N-acetylmuramyl-(pentapeptide) pyrophosphoryl-undecaprenol N-acetylglucosamine transferase n=1 Tax=Halioxenophilus aromaticivorans TaxID=1306992 RepID=A0AAV3TYW5_9ALTE